MPLTHVSPAPNELLSGRDDLRCSMLIGWRPGEGAMGAACTRCCRARRVRNHRWLTRSCPHASAHAERTQAINQARALILTGPDELRARFAGKRAAALAEAVAALRPRPGDAADYSLRVALRELGRRVEFLDAQIQRLDDLIIPLVTGRAPGLLSLYGVGPDTAALLLIAAGDRPERLRSEAAWAHMCAVAPIPASSGKTRRYRLNRGGNREANHALWRIVITRMSAHPATRAYLERRTAEGLSKKEIIRCLKRYVAREVYPYLRG
jgi:transposase